MTRARVALVLAPLVLATTVACGDSDSPLDGAASRAACSAARQAADPVTDQARDAVDRLGADPQAARRELSGLRRAVETVGDQLSGETRQALRDIGSALGTLAGQAKDSAEGAVDQRAVRRAQDQLDAATRRLQRVC